MTLGDIIKKYRSDNGLSMSAFAEASGLSKAYIALLEKNQHPVSGKPITPSIQKIRQAADGMHMDFDKLFEMIEGDVDISKSNQKPTTVNVYGRVAAGVPLEMITDIIDTEEISPQLAKAGTYFGLQIHGDSMEPRICEGDTVIVRQQDDAESGEIVIAAVNGTDATCKRLKKYEEGIALLSNNPAYEPMFFSNKEIEEKPVRILGKVVELRGKF